MEAIMPDGSVITDTSLGRLHAVGLAKEFHMVGKHRQTVT